MTIENLGDANIAQSSWFLQVNVAGPLGLVPADLTVWFGAYPCAFTGTTSLEKQMTNIAINAIGAGASLIVVFTWTFKTTAPVGDYAVSIYAGLV